MPEAAGETAIRRFAAERKYGAATVERWLCLAPDDQHAVLDLARELRLGEHQLCDLWDWAEEIAQRDRCELVAVLTATPLRAIRGSGLGRNDKLKRLKAALRRVRFPQLTAAEAELTALVAELQLPGNVRIAVPEFLEGDALHVEISAESAAGLRTAAECLRRAAEDPACARIFALLGEAP